MDPTDPMQPQEDNYKFKVLKELKTDSEIKEFNKIAKSGNGDTFIIYFANWCGHCKALHPHLVELDELLSKNKEKIHGNIVRVEADNVDKLEVFNKPNGFPTIVILDSNGEKSKEFNEPERNMKGFLKFLSANGIIDESLKPNEEEKQSGGKKTRKPIKKSRKSAKKSRKSAKKSRKSAKKSRKH
jgi:thiol-disulfide isomerase/thioredoxin